MSGPDPRDVCALTELLDLLEGFSSNEQKARYLLTCNWFTREGVAVATRAAISDAMFWADDRRSARALHRLLPHTHRAEATLKVPPEGSELAGLHLVGAIDGQAWCYLVPPDYDGEGVTLRPGESLEAAFTVRALDQAAKA